MICLEIRDFMETSSIIIICPYCESKQIFNVNAICHECYEPIPFADGLLTDIKDRMGFFSGLEPWDY